MMSDRERELARRVAILDALGVAVCGVSRGVEALEAAAS